MKYKLKDVCKKITDGSHFSPPESKTGYPMLSVRDMTEYGFDYSQCKRISKEQYALMVKNDCVPLHGDVLVAKDGSFMKHIFVCGEEREEAVLSSIAIFRPNLSKINPYYLAYFLNNPQTKRYISENFVSGSAIPRIVLKDFKEIELNLPSLDVQEQVVSIISVLDRKIQCNRKINHHLAFLTSATDRFPDISCGKNESRMA